MALQTAKFGVGQIVRHLRFDYRGVIVDVDPTFQQTDEWYEEVAKSRPPKDQPWYHVLVDESSSITYVAERHLEPDPNSNPVQHPLLSRFFAAFRDGRYATSRTVN